MTRRSYRVEGNGLSQQNDCLAQSYEIFSLRIKLICM